MKTVAAVFTACGDSITNRIMEYDILMTDFCRTAPPPLNLKDTIWHSCLVGTFLHFVRLFLGNHG